MKLDKEKFRAVLKEHTKCAVNGRTNQIVLAAECTRVLNRAEYGRKKAQGVASGELV
jgi:hypothetical protein